MMKESSMGGEDFAYYLKEIPGAYFRIGCFDGKLLKFLDKYTKKSEFFGYDINHYFWKSLNN